MGEYVVADLPYDSGLSGRLGADRGAAVVPPVGFHGRVPTDLETLRAAWKWADRLSERFPELVILVTQGKWPDGF